MTPLPSLGMNQKNEISMSNALSTEPLDICDSVTTGSRNKKRKKNERKSKVCNPGDLSHPSSRKAIGNEMEIQEDSLAFDHKKLFGEPEIIVAPNQSIQSPKSSEFQQASLTEKFVETVQEKDSEMLDANSGKQYSGDSAEMGKVAGGIEKAIVTGESVAASKTEELKASPKKRKKSKRLKESDGEKCINSFTEHIESSLIGRSLADLQKFLKVMNPEIKLENQENFLSQARGGETMVMAVAEPLDVHGVTWNLLNKL
ncbi:uncharacterized protein LOC120290794 [Eucalyptus grandis]|uniref:uncharacterized protein LOC120290794 n=1 Tax=Eucalyptus grandis TaxID=71139 RepID=UPI00192F0969|nr:uncharacterized protein LOC120290794 [Eucalyptus grandis]